MDTGMHGPLKLLTEDFGYRFDVYDVPCFLAYDRWHPETPAITADGPGHLRDLLSRLAGPKP